MAISPTEFQVNGRVRHGTYGTGTILRSDERHTVIQFDDHGIKRFVTSMVQLEPSDVAAPGKPRARARKTPAKK